MNELRKRDLMLRIIEEYIESAQPVGSLFLVEKYRLTRSPATIRHEMAVLEEEGYITHSHVSSGRIPTEQGYQFYLSFLTPPRCPRRTRTRLLSALEHEESISNRARRFVKALSDVSGDVAFIALHPSVVVIAGMAHLLTKPEAQDSEFVRHLCERMEHLHEIIPDLFELVGEEPEMLIGKKNILSPVSGMVLVRHRFAGKDALVGLVGPLRMRYAHHLSLLQALKEEEWD